MSIPASEIVSVSPGVLSAGGNAVDMSGMFLTSNVRVPIGSVLSFPTAAAVADFFGSGTVEAEYANVYFNGYDNSFVKPGAVLFAQCPTAAVGAYLRGGDVSALTLTQLQAISGILVVTIDASVKTSSSINLSAATSFSNAADTINTALGATGPVGAVFTGSIGTTTLTVTAITSGTLAVGQVISGSGVTASTKITALGTGTGGVGTYTVDTSQTASSTTITARNPAVVYDSVSGAFVVRSGTTGASSTITYGSGSIAASLKLTQATGAVTSQGAITAVPGTFMDALVGISEAWAGFTTTFEPSSADKVLFAAWTSNQNDRYLYAMWDTSSVPTTNSDTTSAGYTIREDGYSGTACLYQPSEQYIAPFLLGAVASVDFTRTNGRATMAFRAQAGLSPGVTDATIAANLTANGYNFYGQYANANNGWTFFYTGQVSGDFEWIDSYINQIWFNAALQTALMTLLTSVGSVAYNPAGYAMIDQTCADPINAALNAGVIRENVPLSASQASAVNTQAGVDISGVISTRGWYLQVSPASAEVRAARGSPPITLWYTDGGSIQTINLASIEIQ